MVYCYIHCRILILDINECKEKSNKCDANAVCNNTKGSYVCTCKAGYTGDGQKCEGKLKLYFKPYIWRLQSTRRFENALILHNKWRQISALKESSNLLLVIAYSFNKTNNNAKLSDLYFKQSFTLYFRYRRVHKQLAHLRLKRCM